MADSLTTQAAGTEVLIPELIEQKAVESSAQKKVFRPVLANQPGLTLFDMTGPGDILKVPQSDTLTFADLNEAASNDSETWQPTARDIQPILIGTDVLISWEARHHAAYDPVNYIAEEIAIADAQAEDSAATISFAAAYTEASNTGPDHEIGTDATPLDAAILRTGVQLLQTAKAPQPYNWFIDPLQWAELFTDATAASLLKDSGQSPAGFSATEGIRLDQFMGKLYGVNVWVVPGGVVESSGLHSMLCGQRSIGAGYKKISTPLSPTASEINVDVAWKEEERAYRISITVCRHVEGLVKTATTNNRVVDIIS